MREMFLEILLKNKVIYVTVKEKVKLSGDLPVLMSYEYEVRNKNHTTCDKYESTSRGDFIFTLATLILDKDFEALSIQDELTTTKITRVNPSNEYHSSNLLPVSYTDKFEVVNINPAEDTTTVLGLHLVSSIILRLV